jgi:hypothetical protein
MVFSNITVVLEALQCGQRPAQKVSRRSWSSHSRAYLKIACSEGNGADRSWSSWVMANVDSLVRTPAFVKHAGKRPSQERPPDRYSRDDSSRMQSFNLGGCNSWRCDVSLGRIPEPHFPTPYPNEDKRNQDLVILNLPPTSQAKRDVSPLIHMHLAHAVQQFASRQRCAITKRASRVPLLMKPSNAKTVVW